MAAFYRRCRLFLFAPWLIIVFFAAGCEHLEINGPQSSGDASGTAGTNPYGDSEGAYPAPTVTREGGPPPPSQDAIRVGLLLPLSGPQGSLGKAMLNAAQLALFDLGDQHFELLSYDTQGTPEGAASAAQTALDDGDTLLLGPLLASSARAVAPIARSARVPVIAFTSDRTVAEPGVFVLGFTPEAEVRRILSYAIDNGLTRFAVLAPQDAYGNAVATAVGDAAAALGGQLVRTQYYEPTARDFGPAVDAVSRGGGRAFEALLIADGGDRLRAIGAQLPVHKLQPPAVRILGTGVWDNQPVGSEPALVGGWYAAPAPDYREAFADQYRQAFGNTPPRLATLAYDATALAAVLARNPGYFPFDEQAITDPKGFLGRDGIFRFGPDGVAQRGLAVLEVDRGGSHVISPPPAAFTGS
ncbi:MAG: penicillin-binding protein activator [Rhodospirillales bacterium]|nr:penicillin-binding protein activator [Rhodospirillales bacterium]